MEMLSMVQQLLAQLFEIVNSSEDIRLEDMPEYRLYISQLEEFFDKKLGKGTEEEDRKAISRTMIQNYIKDGLLMPPEGKCYNRGHIVLLTMIYSMKPILSIKDIKRLLTPILTEVDNEDKCADIELMYAAYLALKDDTLDGFFETLAQQVDKVLNLSTLAEKSSEEQSRLGLLLFISTLIAEANIRKKIAESLIEKYFKFDE
jgi:hypothetical protein